MRDDFLEKKDQPKKPEDKKPKGESVGTPVDMTPDPNVPPMHQGEKLDAKALLGMLRPNADDEELPPPDKYTIEGK